MNNIIKMIVEIPKGTSNKFEYDIINKKIILDRVLYGANFYPGEYGFVDKTLDYDGDPLDVICMITYPTVPGCEIKIRVLGMIKMIDNNEIDTKLFGVVHDDPRFNHIQTLSDVPQHYKDEIVDFFLNYKNLQNKKVVINGWGDADEAIKELNHCKDNYEKYKLLLLEKPKSEIVKLMNKDMDK